MFNHYNDVYISIPCGVLVPLCEIALEKVKERRSTRNEAMITQFYNQYNNSWLNKKLPSIIKRKNITFEEAKALIEKESSGRMFRVYPSLVGYDVEDKAMEIISATKDMLHDTNIQISSEALELIRRWANLDLE